MLNLDYSLAPERPFPAAIEDCVYAARWLTRRRNGGGIAVGGQSAGANLAAATVLALERTKGSDGHGGERLDGGDLEGTPVEFTGILLLSGIFSFPLLLADLAGFPPAYVACGDEDSLLGQTLGMSAALAGYNLPTAVSVLAGIDYAYQFLEDRSPVVRREMESARFWLSRIDSHDVTVSAEGNYENWALS